MFSNALEDTAYSQEHLKTLLYANFVRQGGGGGTRFIMGNSKIENMHCFQFLLGHTMVPRGNKNNAYAKLLEGKKEYYGIF